MKVEDFNDDQKTAWLWCNWFYRDKDGVWSKNGIVYTSLESCFQQSYKV